MDWDEPQKQKKATVVGESLEQLSIEDMKQRIADLTAEIARVESEISKRENQMSDADAIFKQS